MNPVTDIKQIKAGDLIWRKSFIPGENETHELLLILDNASSTWRTQNRRLVVMHMDSSMAIANKWLFVIDVNNSEWWFLDDDGFFF